MNKSCTLLIIILFSCVFYNCNAQEVPFNNYLNTNINYAFFGSGDLNGTAIGLNYVRMASKRFGIKLNYASANGNSEGRLLFDRTPDQIINVIFEGDSGFAVSYSHYNMFNAGPVFRISDGADHIMLTSVGLNFTRAKHSYPSGTRITEDSFNTDKPEYILSGYNFSSINGIGGYVSIDYLYFIKNNFSIGFQGAIHLSTADIVSSVGFTLGSRF